MNSAFLLSVLGIDEFSRVGLLLQDPMGKEIPSKLGFDDPNVSLPPHFQERTFGEQQTKIFHLTCWRWYI